MRERPTGDELLETARTILREELIPALPVERRHSALMIANALSIAARQLRNGDAAERTELAALGQVLSESLPADMNDASSVRDALLSGNRKLSRWIREGRADAGLREEIRHYLSIVARQKLAESNPKYLGVKA